jgi:ubiquinone/menaquinone biosynthesis C-methylase UbiE
MPFDHFDIIAGLYDRAGAFDLQEPLLGLLSLSKEHIFLDAGGGTGRVSISVRKYVEKVIVADLSYRMLKYAVKKDLWSICSSVEQLPLGSESLDRIIMMDAFHHVSDQRRTIHELWRILAPGGRLLIVEPDIHRFRIKLLALGEKLLLMRSHFMSGEKIAGLFENHPPDISVIYDEMTVFVLVKK